MRASLLLPVSLTFLLNPFAHSVFAAGKVAAKAEVVPAKTTAAGGFKSYDLDKAHSKVGFEVSHLVISTVDGQFNQFSGSFDYDEANQLMKNAKIDIDVGSISTNEPDRDKHLKSPDFFDVAKHPKMSFEDIKLVAANGKPSKVQGTLNMHGVKKEVTLDVDFKGSAKDPWGNQKIVFNLEGHLNRKDFGLNWNKALDSGGVVVGEEVKIVIKVEANMKKS
ncbi:MAG: polyisoprenoid-binding protein [Oligoflexales bacterium]|nr:polyisoprenoid-binding protein [Oligoflexales bacterium]